MQRYKKTFNPKSGAAETRAFLPRPIYSSRKIETTGVHKFDRVNAFYAGLDRSTEDRNYENAGDLLTKKDGDFLVLAAYLLGPDYAPIDTSTPAVIAAYNKLLMVSQIAIYAGGDQIYEEHLANIVPPVQFAGEYSRPHRNRGRLDGLDVVSMVSGGASFPVPADVSIEIEHRIMPGVTMDYTSLANHRLMLIAFFDEFKQGQPAIAG